jgi:amidase
MEVSVPDKKPHDGLPEQSHFPTVAGAVLFSLIALASPAGAQRTEDRDPGPTVASVLAEQAAGSLTCAGIAREAAERAASAERSGFRVFLSMNPHLADDARNLDEDRRHGRILPLHCVPIALKDNIATADMPTTGGAVALREMRPAHDAPVVASLRAAGALIIGKTNLDELAIFGSTTSSLGGQTLNPYDRTRTASGSSGGSAVAVTIGIVVAALGTETVNSVRGPATVTGIVGMRSTRGVVSRDGVIPLSPTMDGVGVLARNVTDTAVVLEIIKGRDPRDPNTGSAEALPDTAFATAARAGSLSGQRIGVLRTLFGADADNAEVNAVLEAALARAATAGAVVVDVNDEAFDTKTMNDRLTVYNYEFRPAFERFLAEMADRAPLHTVKQYVDEGSYSRKTMDWFLSNAVRWTAPLEEPEYWKRLGAIAEYRQRVMSLMAAQRFDALAYPTARRPALRVGEPLSRPDRNGILASAIGLPAISLPVGMTQPTAEAPVGLPIGIDLMGGSLKDAALIGLAAGLERIVARRPPPPPF